MPGLRPAPKKFHASAYYGDPLNLDEHFRVRETRDCDQCARREIVPEDLLAQLGKAIPISSIGNKHGHRPQIGDFPAALLQRPAEPGKYLADLAVEIIGERLA